MVTFKYVVINDYANSNLMGHVFKHIHCFCLTGFTIRCEYIRFLLLFQELFQHQNFLKCSNLQWVICSNKCSQGKMFGYLFTMKSVEPAEHFTMIDFTPSIAQLSSVFFV